MIHTIVPHKGPAHRDEYLATAILLARYPDAIVERRECTPADLANPNILVVDQGGGPLDHHQLPREHPPICALTLVLRHLGLEEIAREVWPWLIPTEILDSKGPRALAEWVGTTWDRLQPILSPVEAHYLRRFQGITIARPGSLAHTDLLILGRDLLDELQRVTDRWDLLDSMDPISRVISISGLTVIDALCTGRVDPVLGLESWCKKHHSDAAITITLDDRGPGLCLFRRDDHPRVDMSRLEGHEAILFAHKGGFIAKTREVCDPLPLIRLAIVP